MGDRKLCRKEKKMLVRTFNLRIDSETMQFDDSVLVQFSEEHEVLSWKTQFLRLGDRFLNEL